LKALGHAQQIDDSKEFFPYRKAVLALAGGLIYVAFMAACWRLLPLVSSFRS